MKLNKFFGIFAAATAMLAAGCSTDLTEDVIVEASGNEATTTVVFTADCGDAVRNILDSETFKVTWAATDKINVNGETSTKTEILEDGRAQFTVELTESQHPDGPYKCRYPASTKPTWDSGDVYYIFDSRYRIPEGGNIYYPMVAYSESSKTNLSFKHLTGLVKLSLTAGADYDGDKVCTILVKGNNGEQLAGSIKFDWNTHIVEKAESVNASNQTMSIGVYKTLSETPVEVIIPLPAQTYENGLTLTVIDENGHFMVQKTKKLEVKRAEVVTFESPLAFAPKDDTDILTSLIAGESGSITITDDIYVDAEVINDPENKNMEYNYADPANTSTLINTDISLSTSYIQRKNGAVGYRLTFTNKTYNDKLIRNSCAVIAIKGATLTKEANPTRYTISGLGNNKVLQATDIGSLTTIETKTIAELTDSDVYTYVNLTDTQIGIKEGAYANINNTNSNYFDCVPLTFFDRNGDNIRMLTNYTGNTELCRDGNGVPQGSGTLSGIIVHTKLKRVGGGDGTIGRYQIRVVDKADIALAAEADEADHTIVEWNWNDLTSATPTTNEDGSLPSDSGSGSMYSTLTASLKDAGLQLYNYAFTGDNPVSFTGKTTTSNTKFKVVGFSLPDNYHWWNFTENKGEAIIAKFSTADVTSANHVMAIFDVNGGKGALSNSRFPTHWHLEWSTDGQTWTDVEDGEVTVRPLGVWQSPSNESYTTLLGVPMHVDYAIELPTEILGKETVYVAMRASSPVCEHGTDNKKDDPTLELTADDVTEGGTITFNTFSIRYF